MPDSAQSGIEDDGSCEDCTAKADPDDFEACDHCGAECGHAYCRACVAGTNARLFKSCAYCGLIRLMSFYGRRWLCDDCAKEAGLRG